MPSITLPEIVASDQYAGTIRITLPGFEAQLRANNSPALKERSAQEYYDEILSHKTPDGRVLDPLFILAIFKHESQMGKEGVAVTTHSWGNTREPNFGATPTGKTPGRTGSFPIWASWLDGLRSTCARLVTGEWYYAFEQRSIGQVFNDPVADNPNHRPAMKPVPRTVVDGKIVRIEWAPAGDLNNPAGYLRSVLNYMNAHQDMDGGIPLPEQRLFEMFSYTPVIDRSQVLAPEQIAKLPNFPHAKLRRFKYVTVHDTGNPSVGADAQMHRNFVANGGGVNRVSFQWTVDEDSIIQITPKDVACWHAGDQGGPGNYESHGIETCINADGDYFRTLYNAAYLVATLQIEDGIKLADKVQHNHWSQKDCPLVIRHQGLWDWFIQGIEAWREHLTTEPPADVRGFEDANVPYVIRGIMKEHFEWLEKIPAGDTQVVWLVLGYPDENETVRLIDGKERLTQKFQRGMLINEPENMWPWNIHHIMLDQIPDDLTELEKRFHVMSHHIRRSYEALTLPLDEIREGDGA